MNNKEEAEVINCIICGSNTTVIEDKQLKVTYSHCEMCDFIYKNKEYQINAVDEKKEYSNHFNSFESPGYVKMFEDLISGYIRPLNITGKGLEFGSGPGPVLFELLKREKINMFQYDPYYHNKLEYLDHSYDLITTTEVAEHLNNPLKEFELLSELLIEDGYLVVMTSFRTMDIEKFLDWWYRRDKTHISFYTEKTLNYIAKKYNLKVVNTNHKNIIVLKKEKTSD